MNSIFEKNINALKLKNEELAQKILTHIVTDVPQIVQENGFYNLIYKNIYLHNKENPLAEAKEIFSGATNDPVSIHVIYGLGLGYLFQVATNNSQGTVILYEPDLNILRIVFTLVDFSNDILKKNVFIADNIENIGEYIYQKSNTKNNPLLLSTIGSRNLNEKDFDELVEKLHKMVGMYTLDRKYTQKRFYPSLAHLVYNIPNLINEIPLITIKDFYKNKTAVIVSAGPSLDKNIETLKKYRDNYVLIVVGTAMKTLVKHQIKPDFLCIIELFDSSKQIEGLDLSNVNFVTEPASNKNYRLFKFKNVFSHVSENFPVNKFWQELTGIDTSEYYSKGTVSYTALNVARILGCSKIVLVGQDLAYLEGQCYSKDSAYKDLECFFNKESNRWEIRAKNFENFRDTISTAKDIEKREITAKQRLKNLNSSLYYVKGINGDMLPTESVYAAFIPPMVEFAKKYNDREYINTSLVGAQIDGFKNLSLEDALKDSPFVEKDDFKINYSYDLNKIYLGLKNYIEKFSEAINKIQEGQNLVRKINNEIKRNRSINVDILKILKNLSSNFIDLSTKYTEENQLFEYITISERIELDYEMKMLKEFNLENVTSIIEKFSNYYNIAEKRIYAINKLLNLSLGKINEIINSKSE